MHRPHARPAPRTRAYVNTQSHSQCTHIRIRMHLQGGVRCDGGVRSARCRLICQLSARRGPVGWQGADECAGRQSGPAGVVSRYGAGGPLPRYAGAGRPFVSSLGPGRWGRLRRRPLLGGAVTPAPPVMPLVTILWAITQMPRCRGRHYRCQGNAYT